MTQTNLVLTVIGADRPGLVEALSARAMRHGANWEASRLVRLAGRFAGVVLIQVEAERTDALEADLRELEQDGLRLLIERAPAEEEAPRTGRRLRLEVVGNDRRGIVAEVSAALAALGVNVEELESSVEPAPMAGGHLFRLEASLHVGAEVGDELVRASLERIAGELMVDLTPHAES